jgi:hypothetical protein
MHDRPLTLPPSEKTSRRLAMPAVLCGVLALTGCGNMVYAVNANSAASKLEEAQEVGAERWAPYDYYSAREHLTEAQVQAAEADYGDAAELANIAEEYADKAIRVAKAARGAER